MSNGIEAKLDDLAVKVDKLYNIVDKLHDVIVQENKGLVEIQTRLIHERLGVQIPVTINTHPTTPAAPTVNKNIIEVTNYGIDRVKLVGNTFNKRDLIKSCGQAKWENNDKCWTLPLDLLEVIESKFVESGLQKDVDFVINVDTNCSFES
jgi:hypothetical protein